MSVRVSGLLGVTFDFLESIIGVAAGFKQHSEAFNAIKNIRFTHGFGAGQADKVGSAEYTIAGSGTQNIDYSGGFSDAEGVAIAPGKVVAILIYNSSATADVTLKKAASNGFAGRFSGSTDTESIPAGGVCFVYFPNGKTVTAGTADLETLTNVDASAEATVVVAAVFRSQ